MISLRLTLIPLIFMASFYGGFSARILPGEKPLTGLIFAGTLFFAIGLMMRRQAIQQRIPFWCGLIFLHALLLFLPLSGFETLRSTWVLSSVLTYTSVAGFAVLAICLSDAGRDQVFSAYLAGLALAATVAPMTIIIAGGQRFEPPGFFLMAAVLVWFARRRGLLPVVALGLILSLCLASQVRINFILMVLFTAVVTIGRVRNMRLRVLTFVGCGAVLMLVLPGIWQSPEAELPGLRRLSKLLTAEGFYHEILLRRGLEVRAALTATSDGNLWQLLLGHGHGATYPARLLLLELSAGHTSVDWRFTSSGDAFVLHFGPIRLLFRAGIFGLLFVFPLVLATVLGFRRLFSLTPRPGTAEVPRPSVPFWLDVCLLASAMWFFKFLLSPAETDFGFAIAVGGGFALMIRARRAPADRAVDVAAPGGAAPGGAAPFSPGRGHSQKPPATGPAAR